MQIQDVAKLCLDIFEIENLKQILGFVEQSLSEGLELEKGELIIISRFADIVLDFGISPLTERCKFILEFKI